MTKIIHILIESSCMSIKSILVLHYSVVLLLFPPNTK